ncbi:MAG TPA: undecaprenyl-diphosphate phosphatase [Solirubrobacteraceae bacterium]|nr:undecaprenyl-diphosphate phosphatase [Solirubrobacteraceae bacterium]
MPGKLSLPEAVALGVLQGPTELLPISSSGHTNVVPWLAGWRYGELGPAERKAFEVALHAGAGVALALEMRSELVESLQTLDARHAAVVALSLAPPVLAGYTFEEPIERRFDGPGPVAAGLVAGALALALADLWPGRLARGGLAGIRRGRLGRNRRNGRVPGREPRGAHEATPTDGFALGLAQAAALIPGVSRNGATLACLRARGFAREDAQTLSWHAALPVILGAVALKGWRLARGAGFGDGNKGDPDAKGKGSGDGSSSDGNNRSRGDYGGALAVGAASAFLSTAASARVLRRRGWRDRALWPYAAYRCVLAALVLARARRGAK